MSHSFTITQKIDRNRTGLNGSLFVHVSFTPGGKIDEITFSEKSKEQSTLDKILDALGESVTEIVREIR